MLLRCCSDFMLFYKHKITWSWKNLMKNVLLYTDISDLTNLSTVRDKINAVFFHRSKILEVSICTLCNLIAV